jgi:biotin synthesis protein BioG
VKICWLNKNNNKKLIVFFAGWSFDENPFKHLDCGEYDVLFIYDYNDLSQPEFPTDYDQKILITWSMGVFIGYEFRHLFDTFDYKIAINGTITPVDNDFGIPIRTFELTLRHAKTGLEGKFYQNIFKTEEELNKYLSSPVKRSIENRVSELENLYSTIKSAPKDFEKFYDKAIVSEYDKIIPPNNQIKSHAQNNVSVVKLPYGHSPFYKFKSWNEIINICK